MIGKIAISSFGLFLSFLWVYLSAADTPSGGATDVLQESYTLSAALTNEDRVFFLVRLTDISTDIAPGLTESWCSELQNRARTLPRDWNRVASEKNALIPLARINPIEAFRRLLFVERPVPTADGF